MAGSSNLATALQLAVAIAQKAVNAPTCISQIILHEMQATQMQQPLPKERQASKVEQLGVRLSPGLP